MKNNHQIERFGGIIKEEPLSCLDPDLVAPNTCVLESTAPYFGYYYDDRYRKVLPRYLYCVLNGYFSFETITRATQAIRKQGLGQFDAATGNVTLHGTTSQMIRIRNLKEYHTLMRLQQLYMEEGITFRRKFRTITGEMVMIKLRKFFLLQPLDQGMYIDLSTEHHAYFEIPKQIDWEDFKRITKEVRYDPACFHFDGALGFFYEDQGIKDIVRVYREKITPEALTTIRNRYWHVARW